MNVFRKKWCRTMITVISVIVGLIGLGSAILSYLPKISLSLETVRDSSNPLDTIFTISNNGPFKIKNITYEIAPLHVSSDGGKIEMHGKRNIKFVHTEPEIPELQPGEKTSFRRTFPIKGDYQLINEPEIEIAVSFKSYGLIPKKKRFRFVAVKDRNDQWQWINKATSEKY